MCILDETGRGDGQEHGAGAKNMSVASEVISSSSGGGSRGTGPHWSGVGVTVGSMPVSCAIRVVTTEGGLWCMG